MRESDSRKCYANKKERQKRNFLNVLCCQRPKHEFSFILVGKVRDDRHIRERINKPFGGYSLLFIGRSSSKLILGVH